MGRDMGAGFTLADGTTTGVLQHDSVNDQLSFTMQDGNGKNYIFTSNGVKNSIEGKVKPSAESSKKAYLNAYKSWLDTHGSSSGFNSSMPLYSSTSYYDSIVLSCADGYEVKLGYNKSANWGFDSNNFDVSIDPVTGEHIVSLSADGQKEFDKFVDGFVDDIVNALAGSKLKAGTNTPVSATVSVTNPKTTNNQTFMSQVYYFDREIKIQSGPLGGQYIGIKLPVMNSSSLGVGELEVDTFHNAGTAIFLINKAIDRVSEIRSGYGATSNRLEAAMRACDNTSENTQAGESRLRDTDMAAESVANAKHNILLQCGQSMLAQANQSRNGVLQLLQ